MYEYHDEREHKEKNKSYFLFEKNMVTCVGISIKTLLWNYFCWFLAGKPEMKKQEIK
tara:strand:+ start:552 stop:722 length:171 start_codon:yes stop_codon:yes gene_type:complete